MNCVTLSHDWFPRPLPSNVAIGERSWIHSSYAFLHYRSQAECGLRVGNDSGIYKGTFFELGPQGEVRIGAFCTLVGAIVRTNGRLRIEDYAFVAHEVVIAASPYATPDGDDSQGDSEIVIGRNAWIGARAIVLGGARIGEGAIVGAGAVVNSEVPPYGIVAGNPAVLVGEARPGERR